MHVLKKIQKQFILNQKKKTASKCENPTYEKETKT
jgi:hypothetical protein